MVLPKITSKIGLCLLSFCLLWTSCGTNNSDIKEDNERIGGYASTPYDDETLQETYDRLGKEKPTTYFKKWKYNKAKNEISIDETENEAAAEALVQHKLWLGFDHHIAKENPKTFNFISTHPLSDMEDDGNYERLLLVNGVPFSGVLVGMNTNSKSKILEANFYNGKRVSMFTVWTNLGRIHTKSFQEEMIIIDNPGNVRKPVVYIYPTKEQEVAIKVHFKGEMTHSYPAYDPNKGWSVVAQPDGMLTDQATGKDYPYLFWEGQSDFQYTLDAGTVVAQAATVDFLDNKLAQLGLNRREATDFITYWLPELQHNPYNLIHFSTQEYTENAPMDISPAPQTLIRVFMVYRPLDAPIAIAPQHNLPTEPTPRNGLTVVEWGGKQAAKQSNTAL